VGVGEFTESWFILLTTAMLSENTAVWERIGAENNLGQGPIILPLFPPAMPQ